MSSAVEVIDLLSSSDEGDPPDRVNRIQRGEQSLQGSSLSRKRPLLTAAQVPDAKRSEAAGVCTAPLAHRNSGQQTEMHSRRSTDTHQWDSRSTVTERDSSRGAPGRSHSSKTCTTMKQHNSSAAAEGVQTRDRSTSLLADSGAVRAMAAGAVSGANLVRGGGLQPPQHRPETKSASAHEADLASALAMKQRYCASEVHASVASRCDGDNPRVRDDSARSRAADPGTSRGLSNGTRDLKQQLIANVLSWRSCLLERSKDAGGSRQIVGPSDRLTRHPTAFSSVASYCEHFRPLLLLELKEELLKGREERRETPVRANVSDSAPPHKVQQGIADACAIWELELLASAPDMGELDVVLVTTELSSSHDPADTTAKPAPPSSISSARVWTARLNDHLPTVGVVVWRDRTGSAGHQHRLRVQLALPANAFRSVDAKQELQASLHLRKLGQLTTAHREWQVLHKLTPTAEGSSALRPELLRDLLAAAPRASSSSLQAARFSSEQSEWERQQKWQRLVKSVSSAQRMDEGQQRVLRGTSDMVYNGQCGFALVQGPPGTGKTTFLRGLLNLLHNAATQEYFDRVLGVLSSRAAPMVGAPTSRPEHSDIASITDSMTRTAAIQGTRGLVRRGRILVCAQSNAALDEIITRLLRLQFVDEFGGRYHADLVRLGSQPGDSVQSVTLNARTLALMNAATGSDKGVPRTTAEQQKRRAKLAGLLATNEREQMDIAKKREQDRMHLKQLVVRIDAIDTGESANLSGVVLATSDRNDRKELLRQEYVRVDAEVGRLAQRLVELQTKADSIGASLRSMELVDGYLKRLEAGNMSNSRRTTVMELTGSEMRTLENEVIKTAHIVFCTLSGAGEALRLAEVSGGFETAIFDEAAQASELSSLIPLQHGAKRVVLVGDPQQLPATVISQEAKRRGYDTSLFERLQRGGHPCHLLSTQYRMHPSIRSFPSAHFYRNALCDGECVLHSTRVPVGDPMGAPGFLAAPSGRPELRLAPYIFFNLLDGQQRRSSESRSLRNEQEARFCARLLLALVHGNDLWRIRLADAAARRQSEAALAAADGRATPPVAAEGNGIAPYHAYIGSGCCRGSMASCALGGLCGRVAILTPYKEQCRTIEHELCATFGSKDIWAHAIDVASVDTYQGKEKDVILFSCVRSGRGGLGFVKDLRRLNVALTRARHALYIVGNESSLQQSPDWHALITDARERECTFSVKLSDVFRRSPDEMLRSIPLSLLDGSPAPEGGVGSPPGGAHTSPPPPPRRSVFLHRRCR